jgi:hypothetical protein
MGTSAAEADQYLDRTAAVNRCATQKRCPNRPASRNGIALSLHQGNP